ncbi:complement C1q subcomponent subunit B-like [Mercenaria mercenaria]|uniref:complement C1q subcomponent subunit B-like n=1 Tax=Mercenaria mercenaria TaxID=6596 RepID=UPI00234F2BE1|nr:complement C1q subcomponent subunit B-like [Mercenaria mercenaria]
MDVFYILCIIVCCYFEYSYSVENEPSCSKAPNEENTSERLSRVEAQVEQWDKKMGRFEETILSLLEHRKDEMERQLEKLQDEIEKKTKDGPATPLIAFNAYTTDNGFHPKDKAVIFQHVLLNAGGGYNQKMGYFTAPVAGLYHFTAHACNRGEFFMVFSIMHEGNKIATSTEYEEKYSSCSSLSAPAVMAVGERVYIKSSFETSNLLSDEYRWPSFMGVLVRGNQ